MNLNKILLTTSRFHLLIIIFALSFGFHNQSLAQNTSVPISNSDKIKIVADSPSVPSYLSHSKKAKQQAETQQKQKDKQKKDALWTVIIKVIKALLLAIALFLALIAVFIKNKDKLKDPAQTPISLAKAMKKEEQKNETKTNSNIQPEIISADKQIRDLVFKFFNMNK